MAAAKAEQERRDAEARAAAAKAEQERRDAEARAEAKREVEPATANKLRRARSKTDVN